MCSSPGVLIEGYEEEIGRVRGIPQKTCHHVLISEKHGREEDQIIQRKDSQGTPEVKLPKDNDFALVGEIERGSRIKENPSDQKTTQYKE